MYKHIVTFKLKGTKEQRRDVAVKFKEALEDLPGKIQCLKSIEVGINSNPEEDWDIVLSASFDALEDIKKYSVHPRHIEAASIIKDWKESRACVDYKV